MTITDQLIRLGVAAVAGGALGLNRRVRGKSAGLRTHSLVSLGSAVIVLAADLYVTEGVGADRGDMTRALQGVVSGIGFIGAGAILKGSGDRSNAVRGLTTAASIWLAATVGAAAGAGFAALALLSVALAFVVLIGGQYIEQGARKLFETSSGDHERRLADRRAARAPGATPAVNAEDATVPRGGTRGS
ncbi:MAG: MgtC/SapB transporter [Gemmatimonadetes bacterium]|jgi:putative Mg2+ transporter-C (MgtC) family protein|nr:MgtC/SapB transporter [Gemmatimonadota bacterium]